MKSSSHLSFHIHMYLLFLSDGLLRRRRQARQLRGAVHLKAGEPLDIVAAEGGGDEAEVCHQGQGEGG